MYLFSPLVAFMFFFVTGFQRFTVSCLLQFSFCVFFLGFIKFLSLCVCFHSVGGKNYQLFLECSPPLFPLSSVIVGATDTYILDWLILSIDHWVFILFCCFCFFNIFSVCASTLIDSCAVFTFTYVFFSSACSSVNPQYIYHFKYGI